MTKLLRQYLAPYRGQIVIVMVLLLAQAMTTLYLPALNADIINNGVAKGDTAYILQRRRAHAGRHGRARGVPPSRPSTSARRWPWPSAATCAARSSARSTTFSQTEVNQFGTPSLITRNTNDVQQVQMVVLMGLTR